MQRNVSFAFGEWTFYPSEGRLSTKNASQSLPPRLCKLLHTLIDAAPEVVSRDDIIAAIWGDKIVNEDALSRCIAELRGILGDNSQAPQFIKTIPRRGYQFICPLKTPTTGSSRVFIAPLIAVTGIALVLVLMWLFITPPVDLREAMANAKRVTADNRIQFQPELSRDGTLMTYTVKVDGRYQVEIINLDGHLLHRFRDPDASLFSPQLSPDNSTLLMARLASGQCDVVSVDLRSAHKEKLFECSQPSGSGIFDWSADGQQFAYVKPSEQSANIWLYDLNTQQHKQLTFDHLPGYFDSRPRLSPDNTTLAFLRGTRSSRNLYSLPMDSPEHIEQHTNGNDLKLGLAWQGDGQALVFDSNQGGDRHIWQLDLPSKALTNLGARDGQYPSLNAATNMLAYQEIRYQANLLHIDLKTGQQRGLTNSPKYDNYPALSPDDATLVYISNRTGPATLWRQTLSAGVEEQIFSLPDTTLIHPNWSQDGNTLLTTAVGNKGYQCLEYQLSSQQFERLVSDQYEPEQCQYGAEGEVLFVDKSDSSTNTLMVMQRNTQAITSLPLGQVSRFRAFAGQVYFTRSDQDGLFKLARHSGEVTTLVTDFPRQAYGAWDVSNHALYYFAFNGSGQVLRQALDTQRIDVVSDDLDLAVGNAISVSADETRLVLSIKGQNQSDIFVGRVPAQT